MSGYSLTVSAQRDLLAVRDYYLREAGYRIARQMTGGFVAAFRTIARNPDIGHKREDLAESRPILFWPMRDYLILYRTLPGSIVIVMIARDSRHRQTHTASGAVSPGSRLGNKKAAQFLERPFRLQPITIRTRRHASG